MTSLYIHIPFCKSKCLFCSFVIAVGKEHRIDVYLEALEREAKLHRGAKIETVYVGGGTPTHMDTAQLRRFIALIKENFKIDADAEFTVEANPEDIDAEKAGFLLEAGINRVSLGVQSLNDKYLSFLGRGHNKEKAIEAFENLRATGFSNINLDLMFSFPGQTLKELEEDVRAITTLESDHLSLYSLTIEEGSRLYRQDMQLDHGDKRAEEYRRVVELLGENGFHQYEISNFAKPGRESRHNRLYWESGNYIGLGIGAHSHKDGERFWNTSNLMDYLERMKHGKSPIDGREILEAEKRFKETLLFGLRMNEGIEVSLLERRFGVVLPVATKEKIEEFLKEGFLLKDNGCLRATPKGRLLLDEICAHLI